MQHLNPVLVLTYCVLATCHDVLPSVRFHRDTANYEAEGAHDSPPFVRDLYGLQAIPVPGVDYDFRPVSMGLPERLAEEPRVRNDDESEEKLPREPTKYSSRSRSPPVWEDAKIGDDSGHYGHPEGASTAWGANYGRQSHARKPLLDQAPARYRGSSERSHGESDSQPASYPPYEVRSQAAASQVPTPEFSYDIPNDQFHRDVAHGQFSTFKDVPSSFDSLVSSDISFLQTMVADPPVPPSAAGDDGESEEQSHRETRPSFDPHDRSPSEEADYASPMYGTDGRYPKGGRTKRSSKRLSPTDTKAPGSTPQSNADVGIAIAEKNVEPTPPYANDSAGHLRTTDPSYPLQVASFPRQQQ